MRYGFHDQCKAGDLCAGFRPGHRGGRGPPPARSTRPSQSTAIPKRRCTGPSAPSRAAPTASMPGAMKRRSSSIIPALEELERSAFNKRLGWLHTMVGFAVGMMGNPERGLEWTARAVAAVDVTPSSVDSFTAYSNHGCLLGMVGEHDASKEVLEQALAHCRLGGKCRKPVHRAVEHRVRVADQAAGERHADFGAKEIIGQSGAEVRGKGRETVFRRGHRARPRGNGQSCRPGDAACRQMCARAKAKFTQALQAGLVASGLSASTRTWASRWPIG